VGRPVVPPLPSFETGTPPGSAPNEELPDRATPQRGPFSRRRHQRALRTSRCKASTAASCAVIPPDPPLRPAFRNKSRPHPGYIKATSPASARTAASTSMPHLDRRWQFAREWATSSAPGTFLAYSNPSAKARHTFRTCRLTKRTYVVAFGPTFRRRPHAGRRGVDLVHRARPGWMYH